LGHITIPIPDGIAEDRKVELTEWLTVLANAFAGDGPSPDDDSAVREEIARRIKRGMADVEAGRFCDSAEARRRLDKKLRF
jgi:predicted transcriptional regulator